MKVTFLTQFRSGNEFFFLDNRKVGSTLHFEYPINYCLNTNISLTKEGVCKLVGGTTLYRVSTQKGYQVSVSISQLTLQYPSH